MITAETAILMAAVTFVAFLVGFASGYFIIRRIIGTAKQAWQDAEKAVQQKKQRWDG
ncbi:MAG: hypothetical protein HY376_03110 [Candidatus Blackburnbacteria bacterium]|nr:hypothetical protein [Candidatus Blackburnbacteria bacterium]